MNNDIIEFSYGGFFNGYNTVRYSNGTVMLSKSFTPYGEQTESIPEEKLTAFWQQIERIGVWDWKDEYVNLNVLDGAQWELKLLHGDKEKKISGSNLFPPDISIIDGTRSEAFYQLCLAVNRLVGKKYFKY